MKKHIATYIIFGLIIIGGAIIVGKSMKGSNSDTIRIGFIGSLTGVEPGYGEGMRGGVEIAVSEINASGGVNGKKIEVIYEDGKCIDSKSAVSAAQKLISVDKVKVILGGGCSNEVLSIVPIVTKNKVIVLSSGASSPVISGSSEYIFRNTVNDAQTGAELARYIYGAGHKTVAAISDQTDYSKGFRDSLVKEFRNIGGTIAANEEVSPNATDYRSSIVKLKNTHFDALFVNPNAPKTAGIIIKQLRELGITQPIFLAYHDTPSLLDTAGSAAEGVVVISFPALENPIARHVLETFKSVKGHDTAYPYNAVAAYDGMNIIGGAIRDVGMDPDKIKESLRALKDYKGGIGTYGFDVNGDTSKINYVYKKVENGKFVQI